MTTETATKWAWEADYYQSCNCDYGCPCEFEAPPTMGFCEGIGVYRINKGNYGDVSLDGLGVAYGVHSPKALHEGNLTLGLIIDEKATQEQRDAIIAIATGKDGGMPFEIIVQLVTTMIGPVYAPFDFRPNGENSAVTIGDLVEVALEPIKNPVTGEPESVRIEHATGFIFKGADVVSAREGKISLDGMEFSYPNKSGFVTTVSYGN